MYVCFRDSYACTVLSISTIYGTQNCQLRITVTVFYDAMRLCIRACYHSEVNNYKVNSVGHRCISALDSYLPDERDDHGVNIYTCESVVIRRHPLICDSVPANWYMLCFTMCNATVAPHRQRKLSTAVH